ncbi:MULTISPECIES: hypothetical protein [Burkholderia]|uniref:hypothetical protein n=1 Tax=Burkholderia TaxID=32008 RepID=UPI000FD8BDAF|nr:MULTISPECIES: hypothetical protein [Burkholderia]MBU9171550.1 hypothetical protein [Burkholderia gladioli]MDN7735984.1 hypothetical protein [Burkholderia gladioli]
MSVSFNSLAVGLVSLEAASYFIGRTLLSRLQPWFGRQHRVPIRKPSPQAYVRVNPNPDWTIPVAVVELKEDNDVYLVRPELYPALAQEAKAKQLYVGVTRDGNPFVWLVNMPGPDGRLDTWSQSAHAGANLAKTHWVRIKSNRDLGAYEVLQATNLKDEPSSHDAGRDR